MLKVVTNNLVLSLQQSQLVLSHLIAVDKHLQEMATELWTLGSSVAMYCKADQLFQTAIEKEIYPIAPDRPMSWLEIIPS